MRLSCVTLTLFLSACAASPNEDIKLGDEVVGDEDVTVVEDEPVDDGPVIDTSPFDNVDTAEDQANPNNPTPPTYPVDTGFGGGLGLPNPFDSGLLSGLPGLGGGGGLFDSGGLLGGGQNPLGGLFPDSGDTGGFSWFRPAGVSYGSDDADLFEFP